MLDGRFLVGLIVGAGVVYGIVWWMRRRAVS